MAFDAQSMFRVENLRPDIYRGSNLRIPPFGRGAFGGQVLGQALSCASKTVTASHKLHSLHSYFLRAANPSHEICYTVSRTSDGASLCSRSISATQEGAVVCSLQISFHTEEEDNSKLQLEPSMPDVRHHSTLKMAQELPYEMEHKGAEVTTFVYHIAHSMMFDIKPVNPESFISPRSNTQHEFTTWNRARNYSGGDKDGESAKLVVVCLSDWQLLWAAMICEQEMSPSLMASLDHSIWFYCPVQADEWMLYYTEADILHNNRALCRGYVWKEDGRLAAVVVQEGLVRAKL